MGEHDMMILKRPPSGNHHTFLRRTAELLDHSNLLKPTVRFRRKKCRERCEHGPESHDAARTTSKGEPREWNNQYASDNSQFNDVAPCQPESGSSKVTDNETAVCNNHQQQQQTKTGFAQSAHCHKCIEHVAKTLVITNTLGISCPSIRNVQIGCLPEERG